VGNLSTGSAAPATVVAPLDKVQTGGFGDPNGIPGKGDANHATNVNRLGSPALPGGPGYGNGTGGDKGIRGTVASTGFGNGIANPPPSTKKGTVHEGGFANESVVTEAPKKKVASSENPTTPVDILEKPHPVYTAEGRSLKIEGDVVLDMVFLANGSIQVNRVLSGLGHGLDDAAMRAAHLIDQVITNENRVIQQIRQYSPMVETYIQNQRPDKDLGSVPAGDKYFLGRADFSKGVALVSLTDTNSKGRKIFGAIGNFFSFSAEFIPGGFLQMIFIDTNGFDKQHYKFDYVRREFLGEVRCLTFDVTPTERAGKGRFLGRIWVEDQDYNIVRFNG